MERPSTGFALENLELVNRFFFAPIKLGYGNPDGTVTDRQLTFYQQIARNGPGVVIIEPVSVTADGREHPKQPCVHLPESAAELKKIVDVVHGESPRLPSFESRRRRGPSQDHRGPTQGAKCYDMHCQG